MNNHQTRFGDVPLHIGGEAYPSASEQWIEVTDPADQSLLARVPRATAGEVELAVRREGRQVCWTLRDHGPGVARRRAGRPWPAPGCRTASGPGPGRPGAWW